MQMILSVVQVVICVLIVLAVLFQESPKGASGALTGGADADTHYDKIKGRTGGAMLKKLTIALGVIFVVTTFAINIM